MSIVALVVILLIAALCLRLIIRYWPLLLMIWLCVLTYIGVVTFIRWLV